MKKKIVLVLTLLTVLSFSGCTKNKGVDVDAVAEVDAVQEKEVQLDSSMFTTTEGDLSFKIPEGAVKEEGEGTEVAYVINGDSMLNLIVEPTNGQSLEDYVDRVVAEAVTNGALEFINTETKHENVGNLEGAYFNSTIVLSDGNLKCSQYIVIHENKAYTFTFGANETNFDSKVNIFENLLKSVELK